MAPDGPPPMGDEMDDLDTLSTITTPQINSVLLFNASLCENRTDLPLMQMMPQHIMTLRLYGATTLIVLCAVSVLNNACVLLSTCWIKRHPLSTTMRISLSLTGADTIASFFLGVSWILNNVLDEIIPPDPATIIPVLKEGTCWGVRPESLVCVKLALEALRLGSMLVTMLHLLALAANHYLGALRPLQSHVRHVYLCIGLAAIWIIPEAAMFMYFSSFDDDGFRKPGRCDYQFIKGYRFHMTFSLVFFFVLILMICIYVHIYIIVQRHEKNRQRFRRTGSSHHHQLYSSSHAQYKSGTRVSMRRGNPNMSDPAGIPSTDSQFNSTMDAAQSGLLRTPTTRSRRGGSPQFRRNKKAIVTTLYILGSYLLGWMPAVISFMLVCEGCIIPVHEVNHNSYTAVLLFWAINFLIVIKTLVNSFIYTSRMKEIKEARRCMNAALCRRCCRFLPQSADPSRGVLFGGSPSETSNHRMSLYSKTSMRRARFNGNGDNIDTGNGLNGSGRRKEGHTHV